MEVRFEERQVSTANSQFKINVVISISFQTFVQRSLIIFAVLLCYYQSWVLGAVDCE